MRARKELKRRLGYLLHRRTFDLELDDEIHFHLDARTNELMQAGFSEKDARAQAQRESA